MTDDKPTASPGLIHRASGDPKRVERLGPYAIESPHRARRRRGGHRSTVCISARMPARPLAITASPRNTISCCRRRPGDALDGREVVLRPGGFLRLPPGVTHAFITGNEPLELLDIHTPGCRPDRDTYFVGEAPEGFRS